MNRPDRRRRGAPRQSGRGGGRRPQGVDLSGTRVELEIGQVAHGGSCVARHEGRVVFVRHTLPGERVVAQVTSGTDRSSFLRADAVEILDASPHRRPAPCPASGPGGCGGCDWQQTDAAYGRELKAFVVREQLQRLAGLDLPVVVEPVPGDQDGLRWRTRVELAVAPDGRAGLRPSRSHEVLTIDDCLIATERVAAAPAWHRRAAAGVSAIDLVDPSDGDLVEVDQPAAEVPVVREQVRVGEQKYALQVAADGFWQVHPGAAGRLVEVVLDALAPQPGERVLDLYSGVGLFARAIAPLVGGTGAVLAIEGDEQADAFAAQNLAGLPQARTQCLDVRDWATSDVEGDLADVIVLDPPRSGAGAAVMDAVAARCPRAIAYVACDPSALARDLATAQILGYEVSWVRGFDLFPMTHHVECVALLVPVGTSASRVG